MTGSMAAAEEEAVTGPAEKKNGVLFLLAVEFGSDGLVSIGEEF